MQEFMDLCWQRDPKLRPSFLEIVRLLEDHVSEDFVMCSFYHEMKNKALEDTFCQETNLHDILGRPHSRTTKNGSIKMKHGSSVSSVDSGAFIENSKPEADQSLEIKRSVDVVDNCPPSAVSLQLPCGPRERSVYDNYGTMDGNMKYGDTPVGNKSKENTNNGGDNELKLSKIFFGKPVPV